MMRGIFLLHRNFSIAFFALKFCFSSLSFAAADISYEIVVTGIEGDDFKVISSTFDEASILKNRSDNPFISVANLRSNIEDDREILEKILRAEGYYNGSVEQQFIRNDNHFNISFKVVPGSLYTFGNIKVIFIENQIDEEISKKINDALVIENGASAEAVPVIISEENISTSLPKFGYPFAGEVESEIIVDHREQVLNVTFSINPGRRRRMGAVKFEGLNSVKEEHLRKFIIWSDDTYYEQRYVDQLRNRIIESNLFSGVNIDVIPAEDDRADLVINHIEAKHRTVGTSIGYSTAEGIGGEVSWAHRNFLGTGYRLRTTARASEIEQSLAAQLELPHFKQLDQTLSFEAIASRQDTNAFFAHVLETRAGIDRVVTDNFALLGSVEIEYDDVTDLIGDRDFLILALPVGVRWDSSDNLLDPNKGMRASFITAPGYGFADDSFHFLKTEMRASAYFPLTSSENFIFAMRTRLGSIVGVENETLPATRRFFSGGGGSIRGYGFQRVGPIGIDNNPFGGRSVNEAALELRWKFENNIGLVLFTEGGNVYEETTPQFDDFRYAAGVGARYSTGFGPVRFDVAFPLNKRAGDSSFQIYISLGQAF